MHAVRQQHRRLFLTVWMISILGFIAILGFGHPAHVGAMNKAGTNAASKKIDCSRNRVI
jgi:hypothetical protein